jgi:hypothetical protein
MPKLILVKVRPAPRGAKAGWPTVSGQVLPATLAQLDDLALRRRVPRADLVREAVEQYVERADP